MAQSPKQSVQLRGEGGFWGRVAPGHICSLLVGVGEGEDGSAGAWGTFLGRGAWGVLWILKWALDPRVVQSPGQGRCALPGWEPGVLVVGGPFLS